MPRNFQWVCFSVGPLVYMRSTASRKFKSFKGLKKRTLARNLTAHASAGTTVKTDAVYTRVLPPHTSGHTPPRLQSQILSGVRRLHQQMRHTGDQTPGSVGKQPLTGQLDKPHPNGHPCPSLGERLVLPHLLICGKKPEIWVLQSETSLNWSDQFKYFT